MRMSGRNGTGNKWKKLANVQTKWMSIEILHPPRCLCACRCNIESQQALKLHILHNIHIIICYNVRDNKAAFGWIDWNDKQREWEEWTKSQKEN